MQTAHYTNVKPIPRHLNSAFCSLPVSLQDLLLLLLSRVRAHICERQDHTLVLFAVTFCDMVESNRLIRATYRKFSVSHMMTLAICLRDSALERHSPRTCRFCYVMDCKDIALMCALLLRTSNVKKIKND